MAHETHIHTPRGIGLKWADGGKWVWPRPGDGEMRCGDCHGHHFRAFVRPVASDTARVVELVCTTESCKRVYKLSDLAEIGGFVEPKT